MLLSTLSYCISLPCDDQRLLLGAPQGSLLIGSAQSFVNANFHRIGSFDGSQATLHNCVGCGTVTALAVANSTAKILTADAADSVLAEHAAVQSANNSVLRSVEALSLLNSSLVMNASGSLAIETVRNSVLNCYDCSAGAVQLIINSIVNVHSDGPFAASIATLAGSLINFNGETQICDTIGLLENSMINASITTKNVFSGPLSAVALITKAEIAEITVRIAIQSLSSSVFAVQRCNSASHIKIDAYITISREIGGNTAHSAAVLQEMPAASNFVSSLQFEVYQSQTSSQLTVFALIEHGPTVMQNIVSSLSLMTNTPLLAVVITTAACRQLIKTKGVISGGHPAQIENGNCGLPEFKQVSLTSPVPPRLGELSPRFYKYGEVEGQKASCPDKINTNTFECFEIDIVDQVMPAGLDIAFIVEISISSLAFCLSIVFFILGAIYLRKCSSQKPLVGDFAKQPIKIELENRITVHKESPSRITPSSNPESQQIEQQTRFQRLSVTSTDSTEDEIELMRQQMRGKAGCIEVQIGQERERKIMTGARERIVKIVE